MQKHSKINPTTSPMAKSAGNLEEEDGGAGTEARIRHSFYDKVKE